VKKKKELKEVVFECMEQKVPMEVFVCMEKKKEFVCYYVHCVLERNCRVKEDKKMKVELQDERVVETFEE
jgi:hypothetical protein